MGLTDDQCNYFSNNELNANDNGTNTWNITKTQGMNIIGGPYLGGNYWSDYSGPDNDYDGLGDTPYNISGGNNHDYYPLSNQSPVANFTYTINDKYVFFNASSSYDNDGNITSYLWDFGDTENGMGKIVNHTYAEYATYSVTLVVIDDDGNSDTITEPIPVIDFFFPEIVDHTPTIGYTGNTFTFNATITDNDQVSIVTVEYWYGTGTHTNLSMTNIAGNFWIKIITIPNTLDILHYFISAVDPANNWNTTGMKNIIIVDDDNPSFVDNSSSTGTTGDPYTFDIAASDNIGIASVTVTWTPGQHSGTNVPLNNDGDGTWSLTIALDNNLSTMSYRIKVTDTSNNVNTGPQKTVPVTDNDNPVIVDYTPSVAYAGDPFTFNATVTDNIMVSAVWVHYWFNDGTHINSTMTHVSGNIWKKTITVNLTSVILRYIISAIDSSGNEANTGIKTVSIGPDYPPNTPERPAGPTSGTINTEYTYNTSTTDPNNDQVLYKWSWGDGDISDWLGPFASGEIASTQHTWDTKGSYEIKVKAKDEHGLESDWSDPLAVTMPLDLIIGYQQSPNLFEVIFSSAIKSPINTLTQRTENLE